jgi:hypothetical protein
MKACLLVVLALSVVPLITGAEIPASILSRTVSEPDWRSLCDHLGAEVAKWHTPTHEPELVERFWEPLSHLKPKYYFVDGQDLGELEICEGTWFAAYRGRRVSELVAIGRANREEYRKHPLAIADAVRLCLEDTWKLGCRRFVAINQGRGEVSFPGLTQAQLDSLGQPDFRVVYDAHLNFFVDDERGSYARHRAAVLKFAELYNAALFRKLIVQAPPASSTSPAKQPS